MCNLTRTPGSETALKLKERGVQVVEGDSGDKASLVRAFQVAKPSLRPLLPPVVIGPSELTQRKNMVDAAKQAGVKFFVSRELDKEAIEEYLRASGLANASILPGAFLENFWTYVAWEISSLRQHQMLKKTSTGFDLISLKYSPTSLQTFTWVEYDVGESVLALLKSYADSSKSVSGKSYPVVTAKMTHPDLAAIISKALGAPFTVFSEYDGIYTAPVPSPDLVALGAKFGTIEELVETEVKKRYG
ncbi:hypothetical protein DFH07DRAFT_945818 [Mycena maculata]|uniref:NmrA-like domain-containing protein n=1 Tax=Mycena maculata TaxID=230809 RepID=A0AAD7HTL3_9AGAR|nr:hypothetical protein DFH07DRAFT_945818 [Mycena maculata]